MSGEVNFTSAPGFAYLKFDVAESPITNAPPDVKNPVLVFVDVVEEFQVAESVLRSFVPYFR